jgi:DNA-3-methyladenine glycosylase II
LIVNENDIKQLFLKDELFSVIFKKYGAPPNWQRQPGFISLSRIILEQQVSLASANAHFQKLNGYIKSFSPEEIVKLTGEEMRVCHISRQKSKYLKALSIAIINRQIDLEKLQEKSQEEIRKTLTSINGIGNWTTDIYLMFCLQSKDIFPLGDIALVNTIKELKEIKTTEDFISITETWKPFRSLAAYFLWHYYLKKRNRDAM